VVWVFIHFNLALIIDGFGRYKTVEYGIRYAAFSMYNVHFAVKNAPKESN
jgi:hypothetical protein